MIEHVERWRAFLATVEVRGPIPCRFRVTQDLHGQWILESEMLVPDRSQAHECEPCGRVFRDTWITFHNHLPPPDDPSPMADVIKQRVLGMYQHEALESIFVEGARRYDPHEARWYSNLVADWRLNR